MAKLTAEQELAELKAKNAELQKKLDEKNTVTHTLRVSPKGAVQLTGVNGKFGMTYYANQWRVALANREAIEKFIKDNEHILADQNDTPEITARKSKSWPAPKVQQ